MINEAYYDVENAASYGGVQPLARQFGVKPATDWLKTQDTYTLHKPIQKKVSSSKNIFKRNK